MSDLIGERPLDGASEPSHGAALRHRVLCVDHDPVALAASYRALRERFDVVASTNPIEALSVLERDGDFSVLVSDLNMPQMNGLEFLKRAQSLSPTTTRLALVGAGALEMAGVPPESAFRILGKPCPAEALLAMVSDGASYHALLAASPIQPVEGRIPTPAIFPPAGSSEDASSQLGIQDEVMDVSRGFASPVVSLGDAPRALTVTRPARVGLQIAGRSVELLPGLTIVGRSRTCHVPINDPHVSRRHACFSNDEHEVTVRNLSSTNRPLVNGVRMNGDEPQRLELGDRVSIGSHEIELCAFGDYMPSLEPTVRLSSNSFAVEAAAEQEPATFATLAAVAGKYVRLGHARDAERILRPLLEGLLRHCRAGQSPLPGDVKLAVDLTLNLAETIHGGYWISYIFDLSCALGAPLEQDALERLYRIVPTTPGISMTSYRGYLQALDQQQRRFSPAQRFLVRRIQGLETALSRSAHL